MAPGSPQNPGCLCVFWREAGLGRRPTWAEESRGWGSVMAQARRPQDREDPGRTGRYPGAEHRTAGGGVTGPITHRRVEGSRGLGERRSLLRNRSGTLFEGWGSRPRRRLEGRSAVLWGLGALVEDRLGTARERPQQASGSLAVPLLPGHQGLPRQPTPRPWTC